MFRVDMNIFKVNDFQFDLILLRLFEKSIKFI